MWAQGSIPDPWWELQHRDLEYANEPFNDLVTVEKWRSLGYTQTRFTGDMYDMRRPEPLWIAKFKTLFPLDNFSWSVYKMSPGCTLPEHSDTYAFFRKKHRLSANATIVRIIVFLEDWQSGHYLEMNQRPVINWRCGDWVCWGNQFPHLAANIGQTDRYTLQITGN
jgi:hypothetical protein